MASGLGERSKYCGQVSPEDIGSEVVLMGWVLGRRDLGDLVFIDLRDREGAVQVVCDKKEAPLAFRTAEEVRREYVLAVSGTVAPRAEGMENLDMATGAVEVRAQEIDILNVSKTPPFYIRDEAGADETTRLTYRYLDLRRAPLQRSLRLYHEASMAARNYLSAHGFWDIQTPFLTRSTPEGARDYLVPSRVDKGKFYALAQSPQLFKQLLMVAGVDKYYQIVKCFRDEDLRADRQPEFTQLDIEMSFVDEEQIWTSIEGLVAYLWREVLGTELVAPFPRLPYSEAMERFGSDKPDLRFGMEIVDVSQVFSLSTFQVFRTVLGAGGSIEAIVLPGKAEASRQEIARYSERAVLHGAKGLVTVGYLLDEVKSQARKHLSPKELEDLREATGAEVGDLVLMVASDRKTAQKVLGRLRLEAAAELGLIPQDKTCFVWITEFPLLERDDETGRWVAAHHLFTHPREEDLSLVREDATDEEKEKIRARMYDLVLNGTELASGSIRIHKKDLQEKVFALLGMSPEEAYDKFGFLLDAFSYGAPPHGGIAFGMDRMVAQMAGLGNIKDVIAFPKTLSASCPMTQAPHRVDARQMAELGIRLEEEIDRVPDEG